MVTGVLGPEALGRATLSVSGSRHRRDRAPRTGTVVGETSGCGGCTSVGAIVRRSTGAAMGAPSIAHANGPPLHLRRRRPAGAHSMHTAAGHGEKQREPAGTGNPAQRRRGRSAADQSADRVGRPTVGSNPTSTAG